MVLGMVSDMICFPRLIRPDGKGIYLIAYLSPEGKSLLPDENDSAVMVFKISVKKYLFLIK